MFIGLNVQDCQSLYKGALRRRFKLQATSLQTVLIDNANPTLWISASWCYQVTQYITLRQL